MTGLKIRSILAAAALVGGEMRFLMVSLGWVMMLSGAVARADIIDVSATTDKPLYLPREPIEVSVTATNPNDFGVTLDFSSTYQAGYLMDGVYDWASNKVFLPMLTSVSIEAQQSHTWSFGHDWDEYSLSPGVHSFTGHVVDYGQSQPVGFQIIPEPSTLLLLGMGAMGLLAYARGNRKTRFHSREDKSRV